MMGRLYLTGGATAVGSRRRSTNFQTSETTTTVEAAPMQISHWLPVSSTVSRIRWKNPQLGREDDRRRRTSAT